MPAGPRRCLRQRQRRTSCERSCSSSPRRPRPGRPSRLTRTPLPRCAADHVWRLLLAVAMHPCACSGHQQQVPRGWFTEWHLYRSASQLSSACRCCPGGVWRCSSALLGGKIRQRLLRNCPVQEAERLLAEAALPMHRLAEQLRERRGVVTSLQSSQGASGMAARSLDEVGAARSQLLTVDPAASWHATLNAAGSRLPPWHARPSGAAECAAGPAAVQQEAPRRLRVLLAAA